ncbi:DUF2306 domain-containing protein [Streptomyces sp. RerS4]|uniref:DUF2306 domain-containing protein n=1 Tax=Streptomyces sp. RerS4 TaxID=2942449 RepID=UPI00201BDC89|nr:DUF2306 domain-containing protein [Streptomyces sp. RerS4]UQX05378.1 DUF2306 domain-containing protein [Streptomyces sp. RerS4]
MTQTDPAHVTDRPAPGPVGAPTGPAPSGSWLRRPWTVPLALVIVAFLVFTWPRYLGLDPAESLIPVNPEFAGHYGFLVAHIVFGTVAIVTAGLQMWPWLRRAHPAVHRISGRAYVIGGMVPAATLSLVIMPFGLLTGVGAIGTTLWAALSLVVTIGGFRAARGRRYEAHRVLMVYSFALCMSVVTGRIFFNAVWYGTALIPGFNYELLPILAQLAGFWANWIVTLLAAHWWLRRSSARRAAAEPLPA